MIYHVINKSIADYIIFGTEQEFKRMIDLFGHYKQIRPAVSFSRLKQLKGSAKKGDKVTRSVNNIHLVEIIGYCVMPTHFHLILKELKDSGIARFISNVLNSYTRYFNLTRERKGPLWQSKSKKIPVKNDEQLLHLTRYVHLNPVTAQIVNKPERWPYSSYSEYISRTKNAGKMICQYSESLDISITTYKDFVEDRIAYQRELAKIKDLAIE